LWNNNCGILPVTNIQSKVIGVVTDRDMFIALATRNRLPGDVTVGEVMSGRLFACKPGDDIHVALGTMAENRVRRLPVLDDGGKILGILSMEDVVMEAQTGEKPALSCEEIVHALKGIYGTRLPQVVHKNAVAAA
jgi:CBS-domain-containing membrane protein